MEHIALSGSFWCQFDDINSSFNKWKKSTKNKEFLLLCIITIRIIICSRNQNINPLLCRKFRSSFSIIFKINNIRTKRAIINHFDITICFFGGIVSRPHQLHYSPVFTFFQKGILPRFNHLIFNNPSCTSTCTSKIRQFKSCLSCLDIHCHT